MEVFPQLIRLLSSGKAACMVSGTGCRNTGGTAEERPSSYQHVDQTIHLSGFCEDPSPPLFARLAPSEPGEEIPPSVNNNVQKVVGRLNSFFHWSL